MIMALMDAMVKIISKEQREEMMVNMMPQMMDGMDMNELMPKMMEHMLKDVSVDDVIAFLKVLLNDQDKLKEFAHKIADANLMSKMMMRRYKSKLFQFILVIQ
jgi:hypothetical protein